MPISKILVIRLSALGDIAMTLPVLQAACAAYPEVQFTMLTSGAGAKVAEAVMEPYPNFNVRGINAHRDYSGLGGLNRLYNELKTLGFDAVADLHDVLRTKYLRLRFVLSGVKVRHIQKGRKDKKALVSHAINCQLKHSVERYHEVFSELGLEFDMPATLPSTGDAKELNSIGIAPFAQHRGKIYPEAQMRSAIDIIVSQQPSAKIYLFGGPNEKEVLDQWAAAHPDNIVNVAGAGTLKDDINLMRRLKVMVSMDSANMHLASLVGLRCISVWGATHPHAGFLGFGQSEKDVISLPLDCRPCSIYGNKPCKTGDWRCLTDIKPEVVAQKILQAL